MVDFATGFNESSEILHRFLEFTFFLLDKCCRETLLALYEKVTVAGREMNYLLRLAVNLLLVNSIISFYVLQLLSCIFSN